MCDVAEECRERFSRVQFWLPSKFKVASTGQRKEILQVSRKEILDQHNSRELDIPFRQKNVNAREIQFAFGSPAPALPKHRRHCGRLGAPLNYPLGSLIKVDSVYDENLLWNRRKSAESECNDLSSRSVYFHQNNIKICH